MREPDLDPTPKSRLEQVYDTISSLPLFVLAGIFYVPLQAALGLWPAWVIVITSGIVMTAAIQFFVVAPMRTKRKAQDTERGLFECAHREPGSGLRGRWARGYARAEPNRLIFQMGAGEDGPLTGPLEIYPEPTPIGDLEKAPWTVFPGGLIVTITSENKTLQLAARRASLELLNTRCFTKPISDP
ncbi:hypothetical protein [Pseudarthrobacter sp. MEB009]|uniref:hypothetical protein n=1 Tax=Pseudarthrobacter sp. MEB009 TaxID=3040326 RepID=UPI002552D919|nr:hypothetical protein [Pseudarthrobacter sp. MEB009]